MSKKLRFEDQTTLSPINDTRGANVMDMNKDFEILCHWCIFKSALILSYAEI